MPSGAWKGVCVNKLNGLDYLALVLLIIGGLNWGLVGFFKYDLVASIFGNLSALSRIIYALVGLAALYAIFIMGALARRDSGRISAREV